MTAIVRPVHPGLRGLLAGPMVAYDLECHPDAVHLGVPGAGATVVLAVDEPLDVGWLGESGSTRHWASLAGLHLRPAVIRTHGVQRGVQLALTPDGCRALFGLPIGAVAHLTTEVPDGGLAEGLHEVPTWAARLRLVENRLLALRGDAAPPDDVRHAYDLLVRGRRVRDVAREVGWSERHLGARVRAETGLLPKQISRLGRLDRARALRRRGVPLADVAHRTGFADQAHLSREWRLLTGQNPSREEEFVFLQDLPGAGG